MAARSKGELYLEELQELVYTRTGRMGELPKRREYSQDIVEKIKADIISKRAGFMSAEELAKLEKALAAEVEAASKMELPTRFQDAQLYSLMMDWVKEIEDVARGLSLPILTRPILGTLPTGQVNAMTVAVPGSNEYLLLFEDGLFIFALLMSKVVARAIPFRGNENGFFAFSTDEADIIKNLYETPEIIQRFQQVLFAYLFMGRPSAAPQYIPDEPYGSMANILRDSMELFVFGHEYGHILSGHLSSKRTSSPLFGKKVDEVIYSWQQELEADVWGLQLMLPAMQKKGYDLSLSFWGADFFFGCMDIVERGISVMRTGRDDTVASGSETHPPTQTRRESLQRVLRNSFPPDVSTGVIQLATIVQLIMEMLWQSTLPQMHVLHEKGMQLSPIWLSDTM